MDFHSYELGWGIPGIPRSGALQRELRALQGTSGVLWVRHSRDTLSLGAAGYSALGCCRQVLERKFYGSVVLGLGSTSFGALPGYSAVWHCTDTALGHCCNVCGWVGNAGILWCRALSGCSAFKRRRDLHGQVLQEYPVVRHGGALPEDSAIGHCWDTLRLGTPGILGSWERGTPYNPPGFGSTAVDKGQMFRVYVNLGERMDPRPKT